MPLHVLLIAVLLLSGVLMGGLHVLYRSPLSRHHRINEEPARKLIGLRLYKRVFGNMVFSGTLVFVLAYALYPWLFTGTETSLGTMVLQSVGILLLYDFLYYLMHRFAFHGFEPLRRVHVVHHRVRHPMAVDSLYLHPLETFLGLALLITCTMLVGPVSAATFAIVFLVYSSLNILVHCGLDVPVFGMRTIGWIARKHDMHHTSMKGGNYASITPIFDILFGSAE